MYIFISFLSGIVLFYTSHLFPVLTGIVFLLSALFLLFRKKFLFVPIIIIGFLYALLRYAPPIEPSSLSNREVIIDCVVRDSPSELSSGRSVNEADILSAVDVNTGRAIELLRGKEMNLISDRGLKPDLRYEILAKTGNDRERHNPGMIGRGRLYAYLKDVRKAEEIKGNAINKWFQHNRDKLNQYLKTHFDSDSASLLSAITTGERSAMSEDLKDAFSTTGLAHLLSISGTHFGLFSMLIFGIFRIVIGFMPYRLLQRLTIYLTPSQASAIVSLPFMFFYLIISGASIPALRSFIMINIFLLGLLIGRKGFWLNSLLFAAFLICLWEPSAILNISFQLSFLAVLFIGLCIKERDSRKVSGSRWRFVHRIAGMFKNTLLLSLSASLGTAPLVAYYFYYFSIISPAANIFITPFIGFILVPLSLLSAFTFMLSGHYPLQGLVAAITETAIRGVRFFASIPAADMKIPSFPLIAVIIFYVGVMICLVKGLGIRLRYVSASVSILVFSGIFALPMILWKDGMAVTYLDVGQGDAALIEASGKIIAIDTGRTGRELDSYLRYIGKKSIDALILTHADDDHSGGAIYLVKKSRVREVWDNGLLIYTDSFKDVRSRSLERGDVIETEGLTITVLHPYKGFYTFSDSEAAAENNDSLVLRVRGKKSSFLFTADAAEEAEWDMVHLGRWLKSDVLKVSHHGSRTSTTEDFLKAVSPRIAVISVGRYNTYGHPHRDVLERLRGVRIYRTDRDGAIKITETIDGLSVKTYRDFEFERASSIRVEWGNIKRLFMRW
ncbi:MAG: DNA internalization-related competence protein ComEC/Rec2 [Thermodesulfovibrionales bacterium]